MILIVPLHNFGSFAYSLERLKVMISQPLEFDTTDIELHFEQLLVSDDPNVLAETYLELGKYLEKTYNHDSSEAAYLKSIEICEENGNNSGVAKAKLQLADFYRNEDKAALSIKLSHEALELFQEQKDSLNTYFAMSSIAINHDYLGDHDIAIGYYHDCIALAQQLNRKISVAAKLHNLGGIYADEGKYEKALNYYDQAKKIVEEEGDDDLMASIYQGLHLTYVLMELYSEALQNLREQYRYALKTQIPKTVGFALQGYAIHYLETGEYDSSIIYAQKTLAIAKQINNAQLTVNAYGYLHEAFYKVGEYKKAYDYFKLEDAMNDSVYNLANSALIESIRTEFEVEKKEREIAEKNLQLQTADYRLSQQRNMQLVLFLIVFALVLIVFLIYRSYHIRLKANELLTQKNEEIEARSKEIQMLNETKSRWFINVAHELRTPLTLIKGPVVRVLNQERLSARVEEDLDLVNRNTENLIKLVNEILDLSKLEEGEMALNQKPTDINTMIRQVISRLSNKSRGSGCGFDFSRM